MNLPSREECIKLLNKYEIFPNVMKHSLTVNKVSVFLAKKLKEKQIDVDIDLVDRSSLLHDVAKSDEIRMENKGTGLLHAEIGYNILMEEGYSDIAKIIKVHVLTSLFDSFNDWTWEQKIVQYADDRVMHDKIVTIDQRFNDLVQRYGKKKGTLNQITETRKYIKELEKQIYDIIGGSPDDLMELNKNA